MRLNEHPNEEKDHKRAQKLRREASRAERIFWRKLKERAKVLGLHFRRQVPFHPYIVDFACLEAKLIIELDGDSHIARHEQDKRRDAFLAGEGYKILRFPNRDVHDNTEGLVETACLSARAFDVTITKQQDKP